MDDAVPIASTSSAALPTQTNAGTAEDSSEAGRAKRSRRDRPCDTCRRQKHQCIIPVRGEPCRTCKLRSRPCTFNDPPTMRVRKPKDTTSAPPEARRAASPPRSSSSPRGSNESSRDPRATTLSSILTLVRNFAEQPAALTAAGQPPPSGPFLSPGGGQAELHYISAHAFSDLTFSVAEEHVATHPGDVGFRQVSADATFPAFFVETPSLMYGTTAPAGRHLFEAACAVLAPDAPQRLVEIFIRQTQPALPILDLQSFPSADPARAAQAGASYGLLTSLLAHSTSYVHEIRPAHKHLWRQVLLSLEDEYRKPTLQTLQQALIVITSRPAINLAQNHIAMGRLASAAQLLGLHLDPSLWRIPHGERVLRKRLWWAVLITDHWRALWYGRPSNISRDSYNVPVPSLADLDAPPDSLSAQSFIAMCKLTTIVNTVLSEFFTVRALAAPRSSTARLEMLDKIGYELAVLEQQLPPGLRRLPSSGDRQAGPVPTGVRSFQLCKLGLEMVMFRLATGSLPEPSAEQLVSTARTALGLAQTLVEFLENLDPEDFTVFWAPYCSFIISSAAALLIRTALTASTLDPATRTAAGVFFTRLVVTLTSSHHVAQWDVASLALDRIATLLRSLDGELPELVPLLQLFGPPNHASNGPPAPPPAQPAPTAAARSPPNALSGRTPSELFLSPSAQSALLPHGSTAPLAGPLLTPTGPAPVEQPSPALDAWWWMQTEVLSLPDHLGAPLPDVFEGWPAFAEQGGPGVRTGGAGDGMLFDLRSFLEGPGGDGPGTTAEATGVGAGDDERGGQA